MIRKLLQDALFSKEEWSGYNPEGFAYLYTYEDYEDSTAWYSWPEYFVNFYGTTWPTEDRAQIFGTALSGAIYEGLYEELFTEESPLLKKLNYYSACIRDGFDTTGWDEVLSWEQYGNLEMKYSYLE
ncbi:MAG: hypothetical protein LUH00_03575 [Lachnospiraceae bacterium]|nr:hypothetical protein [Lachnospiraceae bacterium]